MTTFDGSPWIPVPLAAALLRFVWFIVRRFVLRPGPLEAALADISFERAERLVIPGADEGEIQIDRLLLTSQGLLVLEVKDVQGTVFGSDKMQDWTVIAAERRFTFANPQPALFDRIAAVRQIVRQVPVTGRILFPEGADFTKGVPSLVCKLDELRDEFGEPDKLAAKAKIEAFKPHWELIVAKSRPALPV
ncbi:MAG: NERD domain-containing protein [Proteobacteria bacterium]|nr:NERD domain-containing protein [Pseudomonadota bacterium]